MGSGKCGQCIDASIRGLCFVGIVVHSNRRERQLYLGHMDHVADEEHCMGRARDLIAVRSVSVHDTPSENTALYRTAVHVIRAQYALKVGDGAISALYTSQEG